VVRPVIVQVSGKPLIVAPNNVANAVKKLFPGWRNPYFAQYDKNLRHFKPMS